MAVSFSFIFFFRYESIPILGGRFWIFIWILMGLVWVILLIRHYFMIMPKQMEELAAKKKRSKYLNFSKKKK